MLEMIKQFVRDEEGATAIEYGLIVALISVMIIGGATVIGTNLDQIFDYIGTKLVSAEAAGAAKGN